MAAEAAMHTVEIGGKQAPLTLDGGMFTYETETGLACLGYLMDFGKNGIFDAELGKVAVTPEEAKEHNEVYEKALLTGLDDNCQIGQWGQFYLKPGKILTWLGCLVSSDVSVKGKIVTFRRKGRVYSGRMPPAEETVFEFRRVS